jgi:hypothetical protein
MIKGTKCTHKIFSSVKITTGELAGKIGIVIKRGKFTTVNIPSTTGNLIVTVPKLWLEECGL